MSMSSKHLRELLLEIESRGRLTAKKVVDAARDPHHPLHVRFEWDDSVGGEKWRLQQARQLIDGLKVVVTHGSISVAVPTYVQDPDRIGKANGGFVNLTAVPTSSQSAEDIVNLAARTALGHVARVESLAESLGLQKPVRTTQKSLQRIIEATARE